jgi:hypothetical protein
MDTDGHRFLREWSFRHGQSGSLNSDVPNDRPQSRFLAFYLCPSVSICGFDGIDTVKSAAGRGNSVGNSRFARP